MNGLTLIVLAPISHSYKHSTNKVKGKISNPTCSKPTSRYTSIYKRRFKAHGEAWQHKTSQIKLLRISLSRSTTISELFIGVALV